MKRLLLAIVVAATIAPAHARPLPDRALAASPAIPPTAAPTRASTRFEPNVGQAPDGVRYVARYGRAPVTFGADVVAFPAANGLRMRLLGADRSCEIVGEDPAPGVANYVVGNNPSNWHTGVPQFRRLRYRDVYPGVDLVFYERNGEPEYDVVVAPGADPSAVRLRFEGADAVEASPDGSLVARADEVVLRHEAPVVYEERGGARAPVAARYRVEADGSVGFEVGAYDRSAALVIDPTVVYSTLLGGGLYEAANGVAADAAGSVCVVGWTSSVTFPTRNPVEPYNPGTYPYGARLGDAFVTKFTPDGSDLIFSTYVGGGYFDEAKAVAIAADGSVTVVGTTWSDDFPTVRPVDTNADASNNPYDDSTTDAFVLRLSADGGRLEYSTYLGSRLRDEAFDVKLDASGAAYVAGIAGDSDFPTTPGAFQRDDPSAASQYTDQPDGFVAKLDPDGRLAFSTYIGGNVFGTVVDALALGDDGDIYLTGAVDGASGFLPGAPPLTTVGPGGGAEAFVVRLAADGGSVRWGTFLAGNYFDEGRDIAVDRSGVYVVGTTDSTEFPTRHPIMTNGDGDFGKDVFVAKLKDEGTKLAYATYLGGAADDFGEAIVVDAKKRATVVGRTTSADFPTKNANFPYAHRFNGVHDEGFVATLDAKGRTLAQSTYLGDYDGSFASDAAWARPGEVVVVGTCGGEGFPVVRPYLADTYDGGNADAYVTRVSLDPPSSRPTITAADGTRLPASGPSRATITGSGFRPGALVYADTAEPLMVLPAGQVSADGTKLVIESDRYDFDALFNFRGDHVVVVVNPDGAQTKLAYHRGNAR